MPIPVGPVLAAFLLTVLGVLAASLAIIIAYQIRYADRIFPGVFVQSVDVGGLSRAQAEVVLAETTNDDLSFPVTFRIGDRTWSKSARELGAVVDTRQLAIQALAVGRTGDLDQRLTQQLSAFRRQVRLNGPVQLDSGPINVFLAEIAQSVDRPARNAQVVVQDDLTVTVVSPQYGTSLDRDTTRLSIQQAISAHSDAPIVATIEHTPPIVTETDAAVRVLHRLLAQPLTVVLELDTALVEVPVSPQELWHMSQLGEEVSPAGTGRVVVQPDPIQWKAFMDKIAIQLDRDPVDARFEIDPLTEELTILRPSQAGYRLDKDQSLETVARFYADPDPRLPLPVAILQPTVPAGLMREMGLQNFIVEATTFFAGSSGARVNNIAVAAAKFHGLVVPPGQVFSFNQYLGDITEANGFEEGLIIWGDRTDVGIGGGVCQVSTTAFRAALYGGFEIVERWAHGYRVGWYETGSGPGLDATIYAPDIDFRFLNDTDGFLLIQTATDPLEGTVTFSFYGPPTGRDVVVSEPKVENATAPQKPAYRDDNGLPAGEVKQVEWEQEGADVTVTRTVKAGDEVLHEDVFFSHYRPWQAMYLVGTGPDTTD